MDRLREAYTCFPKSGVLSRLSLDVVLVLSASQIRVVQLVSPTAMGFESVRITREPNFRAMLDMFGVDSFHLMAYNDRTGCSDLMSSVENHH